HERPVGGTGRFEQRADFGLLELLFQLGDALLQAPRFDHAVDGVADLLGGEGLRQVVDGAESHRLDGGLEGGEGGDDDDADSWLSAHDFGEEIEPGLVTEPEVEEDDVEAASIQGLERSAWCPDAKDARGVRLEAEP